MKPDVSICIATYRRPEGLARVLASLARLKLAEGPSLEVLVVDNDPERSAKSSVPSPGEFPHPLRWLEEPRRNIAHARNRAVDAAEGRWLAFIDDDEVADEQWIAAYWKRAGAEDADGFVGPVLSCLEEHADHWLEAETFHRRPRHVTGTPVGLASLRSGNAFLRRALFDGRRFDPAFGRSGGSDSELFGRLLQAGARFSWCDEACVTEFVPASRQRLGWLARRAFRGGVIYTRLELRRLGRCAAWWRGGPKAVASLLLLAAKAPVAALRGRAAAARVWLRACTQAGHLWALLGGRYEEYRSD